jgi:DNA-binding CsgD family transcriptional regulator
MDVRDRLLQLIDRVYAAPGSAEGWARFLGDVREAFDASAAHFFSFSLETRMSSFTEAPTVASTTLPPELQREYLANWARVDPWVDNPVTPTLPTGTVVRGEALVDSRHLERTPFFNEFSRRIDVSHVLVGITEREPHVVSALSINGSHRHGPFSEAEVRLLRELSPHVQRALQVHRRIRAAEDTAHGVMRSWDLLPHSVFLIDARHQIVAANETAARMARAADGFTIERGEIRPARPPERTRLRQLLCSCIDTSTGAGIGSGGLMTFPRRSGRSPLRVVVTPRVGHVDPHHPSFRAMVFVTDPDRVPVPSEEVLRQFFSLTPAEARLVQLLVQGESLTRAADRLKIRPETARKRLKDVFEKTNTHRQSELVRNVLQLPPGAMAGERY